MNSQDTAVQLQPCTVNSVVDSRSIHSEAPQQTDIVVFVKAKDRAHTRQCLNSETANTMLIYNYTVTIHMAKLGCSHSPKMSSILLVLCIHLRNFFANHAMQ